MCVIGRSCLGVFAPGVSRSSCYTGKDTRAQTRALWDSVRAVRCRWVCTSFEYIALNLTFSFRRRNWGAYTSSAGHGV